MPASPASSATRPADFVAQSHDVVREGSLAAEERDLVKRIAEFPGVAAEAAARRAPHAIPTYAIRLADDFHRFYHHHKVLGSPRGELPARALRRDEDRRRPLPRPRRGRGAGQHVSRRRERLMRWNLGLAGLATAWGLIAVLAGAVSRRGRASRVSPARRSPRPPSPSSRWPVAGCICLRPGPHLAPLVALGVVQAVHWWLFFETVKRGSVALAVLTFYTAPLFLAVLAPLFLPERLSNVALGALVPGGIGIALVALAGEDGNAFGWVALACGIGVGADLRGAARPLQAAPARARGAADGRVLGLPRRRHRARSRAALRRQRLPADAAEWGAVLLLGVVFTGFATLVYAELLRHVTAQAAGILTFLEPVSAVFLAWVLLDESLSPQALLGGALVLLAGIAVVVLEPTDKRVSEAVAGVGSTEP